MNEKLCTYRAADCSVEYNQFIWTHLRSPWTTENTTDLPRSTQPIPSFLLIDPRVVSTIELYCKGLYEFKSRCYRYVVRCLELTVGRTTAGTEQQYIDGNWLTGPRLLILVKASHFCGCDDTKSIANPPYQVSYHIFPVIYVFYVHLSIFLLSNISLTTTCKMTQTYVA